MSASAAAPAMHQFPFFDPVAVKDVHDLASSPDVFKSPLEISTISRASNGLLLADIQGTVHVIDRDFEPVKSWVAHVGGRVTHMVEQKGILVTLGEEDTVRHPLLKIWDLQHTDKHTGGPVLLRSVKVQHDNRPHPITTVALSSGLTHLAIGLADGTVLLYRHLSLFSGSHSLSAVPKPKVIHESPTEPITGLGFREPTAEDATSHLFLFIVTTNRVLSYQASGKGGSGHPVVVDEVGSALGCACMDGRNRDIVIARDEAIYVCSTEGRGACFAYEGHKSSIQTYLNYLIIVSPPFAPSASSNSATVRNFVARATNSTATDISKVTVFDPENKIVAFSGPFQEGVRDVLCAWGKIFVLSNDGKLTKLEEKPTSAKLELLFNRARYQLALGLARTHGLDDASVAGIHKQYGDHLYGKGDYDGAMQQFIKTLGHLQPSYVIRKFLDAQRIHNLTTYLQELHSRGLANSDHTTLLLNTYTKLKDVARLDAFIKTESHRPSNGEKDELPFDLETAIRVCRQAGYFEHASYLAKKYDRHEDYLRIQIEDAGNYKDALAYLKKLGPDEADSSIARYGRALLASLPDETTQLLIDLCAPAASAAELEATSPPPNHGHARQATVGPSYRAYLPYNRASMIADDFVPPSPTTAGPGAQSDHRRRASVYELPTPGTPRSAVLGRRTVTLPQKRPSAKRYFAHFLEHEDHFVRFLEAVAQKRWGISVDATNGAISPPPPAAVDENDEQEQSAVWNTLFELYLTLSAKSDTDEARRASEVWLDKATRLLKNDKIHYDLTHALIISSSRGFTTGLIYMWEKLDMYEEILRFWMDKAEQGDVAASGEALKCLNTYGPAHPHLYPLVLRFLTSTPELLSRHTDELAAMLDHIEREKIMSPLGVVLVLSRNEVASIGLVKQWLLSRIKESQDEIRADRQLIDSYRLETKAKLQEVNTLSDEYNPMVFHVTKCSSCNGQLDLPAVHFMCKHSYHQRCIADHETECPNCARAHGTIREIRRTNEAFASQHDHFLSEVEFSGFDAVARAFGRGFMGMANT
ncbi:hypothetical protein EXIGLDRAFT_740253 [Exidia glandulosa HHB12029]|uniref:E3 ubiquitin-protein ligase PEP5 n=1 Tax=Exidia glandulosa HHB12029 TaxID=1314781 RepID=A0A165I4D4_EXIGL|nr:hypothetical protein EXIGLDRAFT_740253 [Exidia glandulosa HHB12029]